MFKGIFFDLGGTLVSYQHLSQIQMQLLLEAATQAGCGQDPQAVKTAYALAVQDITERYATAHYYLHSEYFMDVFLRCCELLHTRVTPAVKQWYQQANLRGLRDGLTLKPDCHATLAKLKARGLYLSIVSNIDDDMLDPIVTRDGLHRYLDHWTSSQSVQSCKPHRRIFELCLAKAGLAAHEVLFVGDSPEHDIDGAAWVGMKTALILNAGALPPLQSGRARMTPDYVIHSLTDLLALVSA
ncbi:MAG: HAD family hydrolase [Gammaproteobacteria bacterium]|nr:HAD family hydrolase [Gammaproteobacteria bacterium]